eukprot:TRINITY_DN100_c0_g1_i2.p1 TRINITY_DN100_c0_g1~~TRINITY_DN100_c0_g1_i2.p1  ORF type:complete len:161 (+),score=66.40 TRINITY_DN100_c0_g1_i2:75-557(+)
MPKAYGYRGKTRDLFQRPFRKHGTIPLSTYLKTFKLGEYVDIKGNGAVHKGMPHKYYHGRTGIVWNVTPRAIGVVVNKQVRNRIIPKKIHVRVEHVTKSRCREDFLARVAENERKKKEAKEKKQKFDLKRQPKQPRAGHTARAKDVEIETVGPVKFEELL